MPDIKQARKELVRRILEGDGRASSTDRRAAFNNTGDYGALSTLIRKVAGQASTVSDEDVSAVRSSGYSEDQIFEIVVCAAVGQATRQYDAALAALDAASSIE